MLYVLLRQSVAHQLIFNLTLESKWCLSGGTAHWRNKLSKCFQQNDSRRLSQTECSSSVRPALQSICYSNPAVCCHSLALRGNTALGSLANMVAGYGELTKLCSI
ncbi:hypothetical protein J6590_075091 [Homalodisca vitripennis]|nr:hypothetical protein J6590_075091 [Homalodisca vitripennis]